MNSTRENVQEMHPQTLKPRKSYLEQYQLKQEMAQQINKDYYERTKRAPPPQDQAQKLNKSGKIVTLGSRPRVSFQQPPSAQEDHPRLIGEQPFRTRTSSGGDSDSDAKPAASSIVFKKVPLTAQTSESTTEQSGSFTHIMDYTNSLDLKEFERECVGFPNSGSESSRQPTKPEWKTVKQNQMEASGGKQEDELEGAYESTHWQKFVELFNLENWTGSEPTTGGDTGGERDPPEGTISEEKALQLTADVMDLDDLSSGLYALIQKTCDGKHDYLSNNKCFKCQYQKSFWTFTENYLDGIEDIRGNRDLLSPEERNSQIIQSFQLWIYSLSEQNQSLAIAYDTSVQEAEKLKSALLQSRNSTRSHQKAADKTKSQIDALQYELSVREQMIKKLDHEAGLEQLKMKELNRTLAETENDVTSLTELVIRLRDNGVWDIHGLPLADATFKKIFNGDYYLHGAKVISHKEFSSTKREWKNDIEALKTEGDTLRAIIAAKDREIQRVKNAQVVKLGKA